MHLVVIVPGGRKRPMLLLHHLYEPRLNARRASPVLALRMMRKLQSAQQHVDDHGAQVTVPVSSAVVLPQYIAAHASPECRGH